MCTWMREREYCLHYWRIRSPGWSPHVTMTDGVNAGREKWWIPWLVAPVAELELKSTYGGDAKQ